MKVLSNIKGRIAEGILSPLYRMPIRICIVYWFAFIAMGTITFMAYKSGEYAISLASAAGAGAYGVCLMISALLPKKGGG